MEMNMSFGARVAEMPTDEPRLLFKPGAALWLSQQSEGIAQAAVDSIDNSSNIERASTAAATEGVPIVKKALPVTLELSCLVVVGKYVHGIS